MGMIQWLVARRPVAPAAVLSGYLFLHACSRREAPPDPASSPVATADASSIASEDLKLGPADRALSWTPEEQQAGYGHMDKLYPVRTIARARREPAAPFPLPEKLRDLSQLKVEGQYTIADFRERFRVAGMLIVKRGQIVYEHYAYGHSPTTKWTSWSVAKSIVSMLVGAAVQDGHIASLDDPASRYLRALADGPYAQVTLRQLMEMRTGVGWSEDYADPTSDVRTMRSPMREGSVAFVRYMNQKSRAAEPGARWNYNTGETYLLGAVLRAAVGNNLSSYLSRTIWSKFAMEDDGFWMLDGEHGDEQSGCCLSATLRDYARLGLFALRRGRLADGTAVLPAGYLDLATQRAQPDAPYGFMWWINDGSFSARGIFGQELRVYPASELVIVTHGLAATPRESFEYANHLFDGVDQALAMP
jgi:CubicO group peptidase (beta-lactamase class C family)